MENWKALGWVEKYPWEFSPIGIRVYADLFQWMKTQSNFSQGYPVINVWAYGLYDPTGLD
jgi:hypothetical protein